MPADWIGLKLSDGRGEGTQAAQASSHFGGLPACSRQGGSD